MKELHQKDILLREATDSTDADTRALLNEIGNLKAQLSNCMAERDKFEYELNRCVLMLEEDKNKLFSAEDRVKQRLMTMDDERRNFETRVYKYLTLVSRATKRV